MCELGAGVDGMPDLFGRLFPVPIEMLVVAVRGSYKDTYGIERGSVCYFGLAYVIKP